MNFRSAVHWRIDNTTLPVFILGFGEPPTTNTPGSHLDTDSVGGFEMPTSRNVLLSGTLLWIMVPSDKDEEREERIEMDIIVDTYSLEEQAMGWCAYLDDTMDFPFEARCAMEREESPLEKGETVRVVGMSPTEPTLSQMFVTVEWMDRELGVPLRQLESVEASGETKQAIADWHYWLDQ